MLKMNYREITQSIKFYIDGYSNISDLYFCETLKHDISIDKLADYHLKMIYYIERIEELTKLRHAYLYEKYISNQL